MADLPDRTTDFIDWYLAAVEAAELTDKRYPVKGMNVWTPYGFRARRELDRLLVREVEATGAVPVEFPTLIPRTEFEKEKEHIRGFDAQVYWVTKGGNTDLDVPLVLRPTSETAIYPMFALWVRSHRDLPLEVYQIVSTFRYETKTTRPFLRVREIHFFEEHTCQVDAEAAERRLLQNREAFRRIAEALALPFLAHRRPEWDKFAGAYYTIAFDVPVGQGRTLQIGTIHHYRENFSRPYGIRYEDEHGEQRYVHQTTFGLSERLLGAVVAIHGDEKGVAFPSALAPYEVVLVPVPGGSADLASLEPALRRAEGLLRGAGRRVFVDREDERPGAKYFRWERRGAPLRLEIGARERDGPSLRAVDRRGKRHTLPWEHLAEGVAEALRSYDEALRRRAEEHYRAVLTVARTMEELRGSTTIRAVSWCGADSCGHQLEAAMDASLLGEIQPPTPVPLGSPGPCVACGKAESTRWATLGYPL